jgi:hypothetical protein
LGRAVDLTRFALIFTLLLTVAACTNTSPPPVAVAPLTEFVVTEQQPRVPNEYLVTLSPEADKRIINQYYGRFGLKALYPLGGETYLLVLFIDPGPMKMVALVDEDDRITAIQPNLVYWDNRSGSLIK